MAMTEKDQLRLQWQAQFTKAQHHDSWGQVVEAQEEYQNMAATIAAKQGLPFITSKEKDTMQRIVLCLSSRAHALGQFTESHATITSTDMALLEPVFQVLFTGQEPDVFPIEQHKFSFGHAIKPSTEGEILLAGEGENQLGTSDWQKAQDALRSVGGTVVCLRVEKVGLKDAQDYIDPFMTILVADPRTNLLDTHDTPCGAERKATHVMFNHQVYLNVSYEDLQIQQAAIFFEFKHYKPKKKKVSTRCWAFMELNELKFDEEIVLELYHKPTDLTKKRLKLHTEKQLYLHLHASTIRA
jgi:hypothetical protein